MATETERILTLELNFKNFMDKVDEKFDTIIKKLEELPKIYATKNELEIVKSGMMMWNDRKVAWIQNWGGIIAGAIGAVVAIAVAFHK